MVFSAATHTAMIALLVGTYGPVVAEEEVGFKPILVAAERIQVIGQHSDRATIVGAATRLDAADLEKFGHTDINRVLRVVPGVNIQEEDGYGLRPNIGLRGSGVERSAKITLMEDGVLIAPAPYAAPSAYYFPNVARMQAIEVRKGSAAIKFGPRTVGGAINMVSRSIPEEFTGFVEGKIGEDGLHTVYGSVGASSENFGVLVELYDGHSDGFKKLPSGGDTGYDVQDYLVKFRVRTSPDAEIRQSLHFKFSKTTNDSNETYLGLTQRDYEIDPFQRYAASQNDNIDTDHKQYQLTYEADFGGAQFIVTAYRNEFERDWFKFHDIRSAFGTSNVSNSSLFFDNTAEILPAFAPQIEQAWVTGELDSDEGAIRLRHNARKYLAKGIQALIGIPFETGNFTHDLEFSVRYHEDYEDRLQNDERFTLENNMLNQSSVSAQGSAGNRLVKADAWAYFVQDTIQFGKWTFVPGVRYEAINLTRTDWAGDDPLRTVTDFASVTASNLTAFVPGLGVSYAVDDNLLLSGGIFKGFNPPAPGEKLAEEETSLNVEVGFIYDKSSFNIAGAAFYSDYSNIIGTCTLSISCFGLELDALVADESGSPVDAGESVDVGDQFNGGAATVWGLELEAGYTFDLINGWIVPVDATYTYTDAQFDTSFTDSFWGSVEAGDDFPYLSKHQVTSSIGIVNDAFALNVRANYVAASRSEAGSGDIEEYDRIDARVVFDASVSYQLSDNVSISATVDNLFNKVYLVARRPIGLRPGKPRTLIAGVKVSF